MREVEFKAVNKTYKNGYVAVEQLDLRVEEGEFLVLLGPSGCGKSTSLRMLAGLETVTRGDILIGGARVNDLPPGARGLGMVFQSYALYPHMTVKDNLAFGLRMTGVDTKAIDRRVGDAATMLNLSELLERKPKALSGGQRQRVAIGRALVRRPKVLLMDEPLSNLDAKLRNQMRIELRRLHEQHGTTTVYVTHDQVEAMTLADRIAILHEGRLQQHSTPLEAYHQPSTAFVASFLGTPPMNLLAGEVQADNFVCEGLSFALPEHLCGWPPGPALYGIRPEAVSILANGGLRCRLKGVERLGSETVYHLAVGEQAITALWRRSDHESLAAEASDKGWLHIAIAAPGAVLFPGEGG